MISMMEDITSSALSTPLPWQPTASQSETQQYRTTRDLPFELAQHVQVYFEELMFLQGYRLLLSIVSADAQTPSKPITVPQPEYLAVTSTLTVHPLLTTRTNIRDKWEQANSARRLLQLLLKTTGPINARFAKAFSFTKYNSTTFADHENGSDLNNFYASEGSLWAQADDFWMVVGWALNCSCLPDMYAARWRYWSQWLEFMLEVLETDWRIHYSNDTCEESLLWQYVELAPGGNTRARRMLRAIFADGTTSSLNEFREVFHKELKQPPTDVDKPKKREVDVDVEADIYGDYLNKDDTDSTDEDEDMMQNNNRANKRILTRTRTRTRTRTPSQRRPTSKTSNQSLKSEYDRGASEFRSESESYSQSSPMTTYSPLGSPQSLKIRLRLLHLLSHIAGHPTLTAESPTTFPSLDELYTLYVEFIKPLPLATFQQIISSPSVIPNSTNQRNKCKQQIPSGDNNNDNNNFNRKNKTNSQTLSPDAHTTLCEYLLQRTLESSAPTIRHERYLTQTKLETDYLPYAANKPTVDANCRVSLLLEAMLQTLKNEGCLSESRNGDGNGQQELKIAIERGIQRRFEVVDHIGHGINIQIGSHAHSHPHPSQHQSDPRPHLDIDIDIDDDEDTITIPAQPTQPTQLHPIQATKKRKRKGQGQGSEEDEILAWNWLVESALRMRTFV